ncbi:MAG: trypco2 family protein [Pseudonocardiaceae bacterium]
MITINDAIVALRQELAKAATAAVEQPDGGILMTVEEAHVELQVTLTTEAKGTAEVNVWVLKLGSQGGDSTADSHKVTVILKPRALDGGPIRVASKGPALPTLPPRGE